MRPYEIVVIFDADAQDDAIQSVIDRAVELVSSQGGETGRVDRWGKRRFAYELKHRWEGYYVLVEARAEPSTVSEVDRMLSLSDDVVRHRIVRVPDDVWGGRAPSPATAER